MKYFDNKVIWVTGASSGIGEGFVNGLSNFNCTILASARREEELQRVKNANEKGNAKILIYPLDLANTDEIESVHSKVKKDHSVIDIVIHCGGISQRDSIQNTSMNVYRKLMEVNFFGTIQLSIALLGDMIKRKSGHHVVISSVMGKLTVPKRSGYGASKHALHGFYDGLRAEHHDDGIDVTMICPGFVSTNLSYNALVGGGEALNKADEDLTSGLTVDQFVKKALVAIAKKKNESYIGRFKEILAIYVMRFIPSLFFKIARGVNP